MPSEINSSALANAIASGDATAVRRALLLEPTSKTAAAAGTEAPFLPPLLDPLTLHRVISNGHTEVALALIEANVCDVTTVDERFQTPSVVATEMGDVAVLKALVATKTAADKSIESFGKSHRTLLHVAAASGVLPSVEYLLSAVSADPNKMDSGKYTPLHWAVSGGHVAVVKALLAAGADRNAVSVRNSTTLTIAATTGRRELLELMLKGEEGTKSDDTEESVGPSTNTCSSVNDHIAAFVNSPINKETGDCLLHVAARSGFSARGSSTPASWCSVIQNLLSLGASVESVNNDGETALHDACRHGNEQAARTLLQLGKANPNAQSLTGLTPLMAACEEQSSVAIVSELLRANADLNVVDEDGDTALSAAADWEWEPVVRLLAQHDPRPLRAVPCHLEKIREILETADLYDPSGVAMGGECSKSEENEERDDEE